MPQRNPWTEKQDDALKFLRENQGMRKWSEISRKMKIIFGISGRNGKQCRNRYINHLRLEKSSFVWKKEQQDQLLVLHKIFGNKWTTIAQNFPGSSQNFIKNHFYSRLRKSVRKINKKMAQIFKKKYKPFKLNIIFKLANISEGKLKRISQIQPELIQCYTEFLYLIIAYSDDNFMKFKTKDRIAKCLQLIIVTLMSLKEIFNITNKKEKFSNRRSTNRFLSTSIESETRKSFFPQQKRKIQKEMPSIFQKALQQLKEILIFYQTQIIGNSTFSEITLGFKHVSQKKQGQMNSSVSLIETHVDIIKEEETVSDKNTPYIESFYPHYQSKLHAIEQEQPQNTIQLFYQQIQKTQTFEYIRGKVLRKNIIIKHPFQFQLIELFQKNEQE